MYIRPMVMEDQADVLRLAERAGFGMTSLPPDAEVLHAKLDKATKSFAGKHEHPGDESYLFALVDPETDVVVGIGGLKAHVGLRQPFYSYKITTITQTSQELDIYTIHKVLNMVNDYTGATEIGSLFLAPEYRRDRMGRFLSRVRFLFLAEFRERFDERVISEIRGMHDRDGTAPFYDSIARHFFQMEFQKADYMNATKGNQFIADLMPKYPIYLQLLPKDAQYVIGQPHPASEPARAMLEKEGFRWDNYIDVFDGGPTLEVRRDDIKTVEESRIGRIVAVDDHLVAEKHMMTNQRFADFRAAFGRLEVRKTGEAEDEIAVSSRVLALLHISKGDTVRYIKL